MKLFDDGGYESVKVKKLKNNEYLIRYYYVLKPNPRARNIKDRFMLKTHTTELVSDLNAIIDKYDIYNKKANLINIIEDIYI